MDFDLWHHACRKSLYNFFCYSVDTKLEIDRTVTSPPDLRDDDELEAIASSSSISSASVKVEPHSDLESNEETTTGRYVHLSGDM